MLSSVLDLLFPRQSLSGEDGTWITEQERRQLKSFPVIESKVQLKKRGIKHLDKLVAASSYRRSSLLRRAIAMLKYGRVRSISFDLASLIVREVSTVPHAILTPVPIHWSRLVERGFNQSRILMDHVSVEVGLQVKHLLRRVRATGNQTLKSSREERFASMQNAFRFKGDVIPSHVILIDDVSTTGATLDACAKTLKDAGVERVEGWVVAHG